MPAASPFSTVARRSRRVGKAIAALAAALASAVPTLAAAASPPPVTVLTSSPFVNPGYFFITPTGAASTYANGAEILDHSGNAVWFHAAPDGQSAADFRVQRYRGKPVLTWWEGSGLGGLAHGTDYIYDQNYRQIAAVNAGGGLSADGHEFLITPRDTALILAYVASTADLTSIGGPANQAVINGVVQEIDIATGKVLFQWNSPDHVPYSESQQPLPTSATAPWDWFHVNAIKIDADGNYLIDARDTWTVYKVNHKTGAVIWKLGGKNSTFKLEAAPGETLNSAGAIFAWQHDPQPLGDNVYTLFDNESAGAGNTGSGAISELAYSRVVTVKINERKRAAVLVKSVRQPEGLIAPSQGNGQPTGRGNLVVGWGSLPYFSEFDSSGRLLFNARFPTGVNSYRAYLLPWRPGRTALVNH